MSLNCCELEVTLCSIPLSVLRAAVGSFGRATADTLRCFLQSAFVWRDIVANRMEKGMKGTVIVIGLSMDECMYAL